MSITHVWTIRKQRLHQLIFENFIYFLIGYLITNITQNVYVLFSIKAEYLWEKHSPKCCWALSCSVHVKLFFFTIFCREIFFSSLSLKVLYSVDNCDWFSCTHSHSSSSSCVEQSSNRASSCVVISGHRGNRRRATAVIALSWRWPVKCFI